MTTTNARKARGMRTQKLVADYLRANGWPYAETTGAGRSGADILGVPGLAIEVKARADLSPLAWIKQAERDAREGLPLVAFRCNGQGEDAGRYLAMLRLSDLVPLLRAAGYGTEWATDASESPTDGRTASAGTRVRVEPAERPTGGAA